MADQKSTAASPGTYKAARFSVHPESLEKCREAIREFVSWVKSNEPETRWYISLQDEKEPSQFLHVMIFEDAAAEERHRASPATKRFVEALYPELAEPVSFTDFQVVAST